MGSSLWAEPQQSRHIESMQKIPGILIVFELKAVANPTELACVGRAGGVREGRGGVPFLLSMLMIDSLLSFQTCL